MAVGAAAGYVGGWTDTVLMRGTDAMLSIPRLLLLMVAAATLQPSVPVLVLLVGAVGWMETARVTRTAVRSLAAREFVLASQAAGAGHLRIVWRHLLANASGAIRTAAVMAVGRAILVESALSFFGVGVQPPDGQLGQHALPGAGGDVDRAVAGAVPRGLHRAHGGDAERLRRSGRSPLVARPGLVLG